MLVDLWFYDQEVERMEMMIRFKTWEEGIPSGADTSEKAWVEQLWWSDKGCETMNNDLRLMGALEIFMYVSVDRKMWVVLVVGRVYVINVLIERERRGRDNLGTNKNRLMVNDYNNLLAI